MVDLIVQENAKFEKEERNREFPLTIILEGKKNLSIECLNRGEFRKNWNLNINKYFDFINDSEVYDTSLIRKYGEVVFGDGNIMYIKH